MGSPCPRCGWYYDAASGHQCARAAVSPAATVDSDHLWSMLLCYVRYAMGRMSTAPSTALDLLRQYAPHLRPEQRAQILAEVRQELRIAEDGGKHLGMACDHRTWREVVAWLEAPHGRGPP